MSTCVFAKSKGVSFVRFNRFLGVDCYAATNKCLECKPGFYIKGGTADQCIQDKEIATLISPRYGVDKAAAKPTIKPCSDPACLSCASDYTQCACNTGQFYYAITNNPVENKVCSSTSDVAGYGVSSSSHRFTGLTLLEPCSVSSCQDCRQNNLKCRQCPTEYYYKPPQNGLYEGCYQLSSLPDGWGRKQGSHELFDCTKGLYFYDNSAKLCRYKVLVEIADTTSSPDKENNTATYRFRLDKGELSKSGESPKSEGQGYLELTDADLEDFFNYHFQIQTNPKTELTREIQADRIKFSYPHSIQKFNLTLKIKDEKLKSAYNSEDLLSPPNSVLQFKDKEPTTKKIQFQIINDEASPRYLSNQEAQVVKFSSRVQEGIAFISTLSVIFLLIGNFDVTSFIFKIIQLITIFDKLRFMNVTIKNSFGEFIEYIGDLFGVGLIRRDDYHLASVSQSNRFGMFEFSVIAYRTKTDKFFIFWVAVSMRILVGYLTSTLKNIRETEFLKMEKRGRIIKRMVKISSGMLMMSLLDILFVTGHQILHQKTSTKFYTAEYLLSYFVSLVMFGYSCWIICKFIQTMNHQLGINLTKPYMDRYQKHKKQTSKSRRPHQIHDQISIKRNFQTHRESKNNDESDLHPLDIPPDRNTQGKFKYNLY